MTRSTSDFSCPESGYSDIDKLRLQSGEVTASRRYSRVAPFLMGKRTPPKRCPGFVSTVLRYRFVIPAVGEAYNTNVSQLAINDLLTIVSRDLAVGEIYAAAGTTDWSFSTGHGKFSGSSTYCFARSGSPINCSILYICHLRRYSSVYSLSGAAEA